MESKACGSAALAAPMPLGPRCSHARVRACAVTRSARRAPHVSCAASSTPGGPPGGLKNARTALITGANTGIGYETARALASRGYYVVLGCRDKAKGEAARARLRAEVPTALGVEVAVFDLADLGSVRDWAKKAQDVGTPLDVLVNNAGVMACPELRTADGFELQLGTNHLGHFLLTSMLLPLLGGPDGLPPPAAASRPGAPSQPASAGRRRARIVNVSSAAHYFGHMDFDDLQSRKSYDPWRAYGQSKLANVLFTFELARRLGAAGPTATTLHPGVVDTELQRWLIPAEPAWWQTALMAAGKLLTIRPEQGAATQVYLASSPEVEGTSGVYFDKCRPAGTSSEARNQAVAARLWDVSAELVGL